MFLIQPFKNKIIVLLIIMIALVMCCNVSCSSDGFQTFSADDGIAQYSFEYPNSCQEPYTDKSATDFGIGRIATVRYIHDSQERDISFSVVTDISKETSNVSQLINTKIAFQKSLVVQENFKVLERSETTIDGIKGEKLVYSKSYEPDYYAAIDEDIITDIVTDIYFTNDGVIYNLTFVSIEENWNNNKHELDHIINSFKLDH